MASEPRLRPEDVQIWDAWMRAAGEHSRTQAYRRKVDRSRAEIALALEAGSWACMVSGGKDSAALGHLVASVDSRCEWISEKDDLDYPGESEYVTGLAEQAGAPLTIVSPGFSVWAKFAEMAGTFGAWADIHGRATEFSADSFYSVVEEATRGRPIFLGLRAEESRGRAMNRYSRGLTYTKRSGQRVCQPLGDWRSIDVYAYAATHEIPLLPVYKCVALMHREDPGRIRKSWWVGGAANASGHVRWLAWYWPSLFARLCSVMPQARAMT
jgi:3'-phosphoadenosine 5'-phosphosulfate sulfotransferase (PAPS reductase)/FAD synthetase